MLTAAVLNTDLRDNVKHLYERVGSANGLSNTANTLNASGITVNQAGSDDEILSLKSSDVAHGMTTVTETDTYGLFKKSSGAGGGLFFYGLDDGGGSAHGGIIGWGIIGQAADTTHSAAGHGVVRLLASVKNGTGTAVVATNGNLLTLENDGSTKFLVDADGDTFQDGTSGTAYDEYDDVGLLDAFDVAMARPGQTVDAIFSEFLTEGREALIREGILHPNDGPGEDGRPFWSPSKMTRLLVGAVRQEYRKRMTLEARVEKLEKLLTA